MPIRIVVRKGKPNVPIVICDQCGQEIALAEDGNVLWKSLDIPSRTLFTPNAQSRFVRLSRTSISRWN